MEVPEPVGCPVASATSSAYDVSETVGPDSDCDRSATPALAVPASSLLAASTICGVER